MKLKERTVVIGCKLNGVDYKFGVRIDDFNDPNKLLRSIELLSKHMISQIAENIDVFDELDFVMRKKHPDKYYGRIRNENLER